MQRRQSIVAACAHAVASGRTPAGRRRRRTRRTAPATGMPIDASSGATSDEVASPAARPPRARRARRCSGVLEERQRRVARASRSCTRFPAPTPRSRPTRALWQCGHIGRGGWRSVAAAAAALDQQPVLPQRRPRRTACRGSSTARGGSSRRGSVRPELEDAERLAADDLAVAVGVRRHPGDEVAGTDAGLLLRRDGLEHRRRRHDVAQSQVPDDLELGVRTRACRRSPPRRAGRAPRHAPPSTGEPPRSAMPVIRGVAIVQVCSISGGATISPKRERAAASGSVYTGFSSSNAAAQCRIIGWLTGSGARASARRR